MAADRIDFLDYVRGVSLLGILTMNIGSFATVSAAYLNPTATGPLSGSDACVWAATRLLADQKFLGLFAMLFGAGLALYGDGAEARGDDAVRLHRRRMLWLAGFGLLHATLVWHGDVLFCYGACGLALTGARRWSARRLLGTGLAIAVAGSSLWVLGGLTYPRWPPDVTPAPAWSPDAAARAAEIAAYRSGWLGQMAFRLPQALDNEVGGLVFLTGWKASSSMLLGLALYRLDVITGRAPRRVYATLAAVGFGVGLPLTALGMVADARAGFSIGFSFFFGTLIVTWTSYLVSLGWLGLLGLGQPLSGPIRAIGRTAFSNYVLQSVVGTWVFYGHGLGWFGELGRTRQLGVLAVVWALNLGFSALWLRWFRQGPLEWLWRGLVRGHFEPLLRAAVR